MCHGACSGRPRPHSFGASRSRPGSGSGRRADARLQRVPDASVCGVPGRPHHDGPRGALLQDCYRSELMSLHPSPARGKVRYCLCMAKELMQQELHVPLVVPLGTFRFAAAACSTQPVLDMQIMGVDCTFVKSQPLMHTGVLERAVESAEASFLCKQFAPYCTWPTQGGTAKTEHRPFNGQC